MEKCPKVPSMTRLSIQQVADFYNLTPEAVRIWTTDGCPHDTGRLKNPKAISLDLYEVHFWLKARDQSANPAKLRIDMARAKKLELENMATEGELVPRAEMEAILRSRMRSLRNFFERGLPMNRTQRAMKTVDELANIDHEFVRSAMEAYFGGPGWAKEV
jgi:phage terminase Nu1 subunit (DNA packaging protein)